ncbi:MAG: PQQ-binding-like beta-propeller repeat protein [Hadesarchaea archaeon]|nr:PQQ-binding-like beta-propeller repeat protein [Hadesarchaea archaeon]
MRKPTGIALIGLAFMVLLSSAQLVQSQLADSPWPKFGGRNPGNTGQGSYVGPGDNTVMQLYDISMMGSNIDFLVVGRDETIYFGGEFDNRFFAVNKDGTLKWQVDLGWTNGFPAIALDGTIYVASTLVDIIDGDITYYTKLHALTPLDGSKKWSRSLGDVRISSITLADNNKIYFGTSDNKLYSVRDKGEFAEIEWTFPVGGQINTCPALFNNTIYFASWEDNTLWAVYENGGLKWFYRFNDKITSSPIVSDGTVYVSSKNDLYSVFDNCSNAVVQWQFEAGGPIWSSPSVGDNVIYFGSYDRNLYAVELDGSIKWSFLTDSWIDVQPVIDTQGAVYFGSSDTFYALNPDGTLKWKYSLNLQGVVSLPPVMGSNGIIYVGGTLENDVLFMFGKVSVITIPPDNTFFIAVATGIIIVLIILLAWLKRR